MDKMNPSPAPGRRRVKIRDLMLGVMGVALAFGAVRAAPEALKAVFYSLLADWPFLFGVVAAGLVLLAAGLAILAVGSTLGLLGLVLFKLCERLWAAGRRPRERPDEPRS